MDALWTTVATVLPVLALAVVLEIRAYGLRWLDQPVWLRTVQAVSWIAFFIGACIAMLGTLRALRHDPARPAPDWLADVSINVVALGIGVLILAPAIELVVRVLIPFVAFLRTAHPSVAFKAWSLHLRARASRTTYSMIRGRALELGTRGEQVLAHKTIELQENAEGIRAAREVLFEMAEDDPRRSDTVSYLKDAEEWERLTEAYVEEGRQVLSSRPRDADAQFDRTVADTKSLIDELKSLSSQERQEVERFLQSLPWGLNPVIPPPPPEPPQHQFAPRRHARPGSGAARQPRTGLRSQGLRHRRK